MSNACENCGCESSVMDHLTMDETCSSCGLVMGSYAIVDTFQFKCHDENDPGAEEQVPQTEEQHDLSVSNFEYHHVLTAKERNLLNAKCATKQMCERVLVSKKVQDEAMDLVVQYENNRSHHGRKPDNAIILGIIYLASKRANQTIALERLCREACLDDLTGIKRMYQDVVKKVLKFDDGFINIRELVPATVDPIKSKLGNTWRFIYQTNVADMADYCEKENVGDRRPRPVTIILACIYLIIEHFQLGMTVEEVVKTYNQATQQHTAFNTVKTCISSWQSEKLSILAKIQ